MLGGARAEGGGDTETGACVATLEGHTDGVRALAFLPDKNFLASASDDSTIKLWNVDFGEVAVPVAEQAEGAEPGGACAASTAAAAPCAPACGSSSDASSVAAARASGGVALTSSSSDDE